jgi:hypothetical protein
MLFAVPLAAVILFGAGCSYSFGAKAGTSSSQTSGTLKQPAPAKSPTQQPVIPPEAAKVPKPY